MNEEKKTILCIDDDPDTIEEKRRKVTIWDVLFQDVSKLLDLVQRWPRMKYQLVY